MIDTDDRGPIPRVNLSIKLSALDSQFDAIDPAAPAAASAGRLRELFCAAQRLGAFINVDMESYDKKALTLEIFQSSPERAGIPRLAATWASCCSATCGYGARSASDFAIGPPARHAASGCGW